MSPAPAQAHISGEEKGGGPWVWVLPALAVCFVAISSQSLWIDEAFMARKASQPTLADWWRMMPEGNGSDLQMPLYMIYMWGFAKIFGLGEWTLRAANIPWFVIGAAAFISALPKPQRVAAAIVTLLSPFVWFYLNEARPYAMQIGCSLAVFGALYRLSQDSAMDPRCERNWMIGFCTATVALCGSSLLGVLWAGAAFLSMLFLFSRKQLLGLLRSHWPTFSVSVILLVALAGYYLWAIKFGAQALGAGNRADGGALTAVKSAAHFRQGFAGGTELQNLAFVGYELLGFSGLGPGRLEIRTEKLQAFRHFAPQLGFYALAVCVVLSLGMRRIVGSPRPARGMGLVLVALLPAIMLAVAGYFLGFLLLSRHCAPFLAALSFVLSLGIAGAFSARNCILKGCTCAFLILSVVSCLSLRFAKRHKKDDYRDAAQAAIAALQLGQKVWWSASEDGAAYYHVPLAGGAARPGRALLVLNPAAESLAALPSPDVLVITTKADLYDSQGALAKYVRNNPYVETASFPAFAVWQRKNGQNHQ